MNYGFYISLILVQDIPLQRYSAGKMVSTKKDEEIIKKIFEMWITYFGCPVMFLADNGGEFANEKYKEMQLY